MDKNHSFQWEGGSPKNIIVRMPNWLGDTVMSTPVLASLREHFPHSTLTAMVKKEIAPILQENPHIDELYAFQRRSGWVHGTRDVWKIVQSLYWGEYDLGILLTNSFSSAWWFWRGDVKNRLGYSTHWRNLLLNQAVPLPKNLENQHLVLTYKELLLPLGIPRSDIQPQLYLSKQELNDAKELLRNVNISENDCLIGINPGAAYGSAKCWLPSRFSEVTNKLLEDSKVKIIYFSDTAGAPLVDKICGGFPERVINLAGKTSLRQLMALIKLCTAFLTNDSGPMHIAAALGTPLVALFGSTSAIKTGPYNHGVIIHKHVDCSPCYKRICPIDFRCMKKIESKEVYEALKKIIDLK